MKVVYIAGPFRGPTAWDIECNVRRAEVASLEIWRMGAAALCPHTNTRFFHGLETDQLWIDGTLELMRRCDAVYVLDSWQASTGTRGELREAERLGLPTFFGYLGVGQLRDWLRREQLTNPSNTPPFAQKPA